MTDVGRSGGWAETRYALHVEGARDASLERVDELVAERDRLRQFVDNLIAGRYFGGGWADKIIAAAKEARDA